ncbi:hypothetical protein E4U19_007540 [Claviceps sp. Clav32 group G5]|nr:hypothetical protein E4U19_007540 [Claviceps sp. Clav32 group G5]
MMKGRRLNLRNLGRVKSGSHELGTFMERPIDPQRPRPQDYEAKAGIEEPTQASHLSKDGLEAFIEDKLQHKDLVDDCKIQFDHYKEERAKGPSTAHSCSINDSLTFTRIVLPRGVNTYTDWISQVPNLQNSVGVDDDTERKRVLAWYRTTFKPMRNLNKVTIGPHGAWGKTNMTGPSAELWGVSDVANTICMTPDFMTAISTHITLHTT